MPIPGLEEAIDGRQDALSLSEDDVVAARARKPEGRRIREEISALVPLLRRDAVAGERLGGLTPDVLHELNRAGAFRLQLPTELGGHGLGVRDTVEIIAEIARGDGSPAWLAVVSGGATSAVGFSQRAADEVFAVSDSWVGPLAFGASGPISGTGTAEKVEGGWNVSGTWPFASGSKHAAWGFVFAKYLDENGDSHQGMFLLSRDQVRILDDWQVMGLQGTSSNSVTVDGEAFVPDHRFLPVPEMMSNLEIARHRYEGIAFRYLPLGVVVPLSFGALALGMARGAMECFVELAHSRKPFNMPYTKVIDMPSAQVTAGTARAMINTAGIVISHHADEADLRSLRGEPYAPEESSELSMDVVHAIRLCSDAIDMLQLTIGSSTASLQSPIQRFVRDMRVLSMHGALRFDPTAEINGRNIFGFPPYVPFADLVAPGSKPAGPPPGMPAGPPPGMPAGPPPGMPAGPPPGVLAGTPPFAPTVPAGR